MSSPETSGTQPTVKRAVWSLALTAAIIAVASFNLTTGPMSELENHEWPRWLLLAGAGLAVIGGIVPLIQLITRSRRDTHVEARQDEYPPGNYTAASNF